jgi:hypothetical protein
MDQHKTWRADNVSFTKLHIVHKARWLISLQVSPKYYTPVLLGIRCLLRRYPRALSPAAPATRKGKPWCFSRFAGARIRKCHHSWAPGRVHWPYFDADVNLPGEIINLLCAPSIGCALTKTSIDHRDFASSSLFPLSKGNALSRDFP